VDLTWANRITISRILLIAPFVALMLEANNPAYTPAARNLCRYGAIAVYAYMAFSDALDGYIARKTHKTSTLGRFLDPLADKLLVTSACLLLTSKRGGVEGFILPATVVVLIVGKDLFLLIGFVAVYMVTSKIHIVPALLGKTATVLQCLMVSTILIAPEVSSFFSGWKHLVHTLWWSAAAVAVMATLLYIRAGSRFLEQYEREQANQPPQSSPQAETHHL